MKKCTQRKPLSKEELDWTRNNRSNYRIRDQLKSDIVIENGETFIRTEKRYPFLSRCTSAYERHKKIQENKRNANGQKTKRSRCSRRAPKYNGKELKWTEEKCPKDIRISNDGKKKTISLRKYEETGDSCISKYEYAHRDELLKNLVTIPKLRSSQNKTVKSTTQKEKEVPVKTTKTDSDQQRRKGFLKYYKKKLNNNEPEYNITFHMKNQHKLGNQTYQNLTSSEKQNKRKDKFLENYNKKN